MKKTTTEKFVVVIGSAPTIALKKYQVYRVDYFKKYQIKLKFILLHDRATIPEAELKRYRFFDIILKLNFSDAEQLQIKLLPYSNDTIAVLCRAESYIPQLSNVTPFFPYTKLPTPESLLWSVDKLAMRKRFKAFNSKITPRFKLVEDYSEKTLDKVERTVKYPMIVKPLGLAQSILVSNVYHREELQKTLKRTFKKLDKVYSDNAKTGNRGVLVEHLLEGEQYSIDIYVNSKGKPYYCPVVHVKTGKQIGFDDYFGYRQMTPTRLKKTSIEEVRKVALESVKALGLRSTTAHVELLRTEDGWKLIEVGPRVGGLREELYELSYGFDHAINDLLIRAGKPPKIVHQIKGYTAGMKLFATEEGVIVSIKGLRTIKKLDSFVAFWKKPKKVGDKALFAKHGGKSVANVILHNKDRSKLLADIRRLEQVFKVEVKKTSNRK